MVKYINMEKQEISSIEQFANVNSNVLLLGYDKVGNKVGMVPISSVQSKIPYCGCRWRKDSATPEGEPIGDLEMLAELPSILKLGGYLVQNDHSRRKLSSTNHFQFANGGKAALDGSMGHYNWGWGIKFYYANWEDETYIYEAVSTAPMSGKWNYEIPVASTACAGASALDRTNNILVNYCNRTSQYRGGTNDSSFDGKWNTMCGKPVVNIAENTLQRYAEKNGARWGATMFPIHFVIGCLCRIVFHNRNIQAPYNSSLTADGLHQGGLGNGIDNVNTSFGNQYATVDIDALADRGDAIGVFSIDVKNGSATQLTIKNIPCFFGLKNFYHYMWQMYHGCNITYNSDKTINVYAQKVWNSETVQTDTTTGMKNIGSIPSASSESWNYGKKMNLDNMLMFPTEFGGSSSTYYCDGFYHAAITSGLRGLLGLGYAHNGGGAGVGCLSGNSAPSYTGAHNGAALCEAEEDWNTEPFWQP